MEAQNHKYGRQTIQKHHPSQNVSLNATALSRGHTHHSIPLAHRAHTLFVCNIAHSLALHGSRRLKTGRRRLSLPTETRGLSRTRHSERLINCCKPRGPARLSRASPKTSKPVTEKDGCQKKFSMVKRSPHYFIRPLCRSAAASSAGSFSFRNIAGESISSPNYRQSFTPANPPECA